MKYETNPFRGRGLPDIAIPIDGAVRTDPSAVLKLLAHCPVANVTPLVDMRDLAKTLGIDALWIKDERTRMGLGSFKALGAAYAIAKAAYKKKGDTLFEDGAAKNALEGEVYTAATAGNHGLSIAAGARAFGAKAVIFIAETVPEAFATRLKSYGADVIRAGEEYEASLIAAKEAAAENGWHLLSDTSWPGYTEPPSDIMEGYLVMAAEAADQLDALSKRPDYVFLQAGVGGLAGAVAVYLRARWGDDLQIIVVEPDAAPALKASIEAGHPVVTEGPVSNMGRLDCKEPSYLALKALAQSADGFMTVTDEEATETIAELVPHGLVTSPSGGAGFTGLKTMLAAGFFGLNAQSKVLLFLSEGPPDA